MFGRSGAECIICWSCYCVGLSPAKLIRLMDLLNICCTTERSFYRYASDFVQPVIFHMWNQHQSDLLNQMKCNHQEVIVGGDGRADSPGHSAKYGTYTIMDLLANNVLSIQLVQVRFA